MKILYGTGNPAKLSVMRSRLERLDIELIGLNDLKAEEKIIPDVLEDGKTPLENARLKAKAYYEAFHMPVFSCDSGLYFDNVSDEVQPGVHVYEAMDPSMESEKFIMTDKPHSTIRKKGFPLDSISIDIKTGKYYYDLQEDKLEQVAVEDGFLDFFKSVIG